LAHRPGGHSEKVGAVLPPWIGLVSQTQISLVNQRRRLECVIAALSAHLMMGEASEFLIDQRSQLRESSIVPMTPLLQELGHPLLRDQRLIHNPFS
jgi:hypothetical protein